jgi:UDP-N-acetyl-D-galactosamine dehydrogenase
MNEHIAVIGLGYVGLPLLVSLARKFPAVTGFDIDPKRIAALQSAHDWTGEVEAEALRVTTAKLTHDSAALQTCTIYIVTVPTPIDQGKRPDLEPVQRACDMLAMVLKGRTPNPQQPPLIVFESTVYPGLTEDFCGPRIAAGSGLKQGVDFKLGYSPERINPGDKKNRLETIIKIVSAEDASSLQRLQEVYGGIIEAGLHLAPSIKVAEAAKVLENTQRDLNVALMNELALICDRLDIRTHDVLQAAGTKWNFLKFTPGLVGGHCIGVDPYYLTTRAEELGYHPQVILAGRRINDNMPVFIAQKLIKLLISGHVHAPPYRVGILGLTFKENVRDLRNSRVPDIVRELRALGIEVLIHDPMVDPDHARHEYSLELAKAEDLKDLHALVLAVPHDSLMQNLTNFWQGIRPDGYVIDIKSVLDTSSLPPQLRYWSL